MAAGAVAIVLLVGALLGAPSPAGGGQQEAKKYTGRAVADVLRELQATRLKIIFSSERVPPNLRVLREPRGTHPRDIALQILEPHGLTLEDGPGGTFIVVARPRRQPDPAPPGLLKTEVPGDPEAVRIAERVDVTDRSSGTGLSPRLYTVDPSEAREMAGSLDDVLHSLQILPGVAAINDEDGKLAVRGAGPEHNLIVFDGVQIHNAAAHGRVHDQLHESRDGSRHHPGSVRARRAVRRPAVVGRQP